MGTQAGGSGQSVVGRWRHAVDDAGDASKAVLGCPSDPVMPFHQSCGFFLWGRLQQAVSN